MYKGITCLIIKSYHGMEVQVVQKYNSKFQDTIILLLHMCGLCSPFYLLKIA